MEDNSSLETKYDNLEMTCKEIKIYHDKFYALIKLNERNALINENFNI